MGIKIMATLNTALAMRYGVRGQFLHHGELEFKASIPTSTKINIRYSGSSNALRRTADNAGEEIEVLPGCACDVSHFPD
jgi:hypothetical protein